TETLYASEFFMVLPTIKNKRTQNEIAAPTIIKTLGNFEGLLGFLTTMVFAALSPNLLLSLLVASTINSTGQIISSKFRNNNLPYEGTFVGSFSSRTIIPIAHFPILLPLK